MSRAQRLLDVIQLLRRHRRPVAACRLAEELRVSLRTIYRDIETLKGQGAHIDGEPGIGYILRPGFMLPPLMFSEEEIEALVLGGRWVTAQPDEPLGKAARNALAKIAAVLPDDLQRTLETSSLMVARRHPAAGDAELPMIRTAIRTERKLRITYSDESANRTNRTIWPIALGFFDRLRMVAAWCETRGDYRHFRTDRILSITLTERGYPRRRTDLLREWRQRECITER
ncbi:YafY family transcriptional regulator [Bradyrhizobium manausense]|uniref:helix-turn-helix transcriptional regulator n=1 Tax=Bradyrhizobium manausense TaxID=989370 RepID=UPI001BA71588|nr:YafY family protein [Bradyrhizobium manausense]MBR0838031.1 YafY family transcriptional regulator [Bradyrhizobium manausense]